MEDRRPDCTACDHPADNHSPMILSTPVEQLQRCLRRDCGCTKFQVVTLADAWAEGYAAGSRDEYAQERSVYKVEAAPNPYAKANAAKWTDLVGIDPNFTGDLTTDEYLTRSRGEA